MQAISNYGEISSNQSKPIKKINDLVAISNHNLDDTITTIDNIQNLITISNVDYSSLSSQYIAIGHEIAKIESISYDGVTSTIEISREYFGTVKDDIDLSNHHIRTVDIYTNIKSWEYNNYNDSRTELFPFQLESGSVEIFTEDDVNIKRRSTAIYLFKGFNNQNMLKYTGFISRRNIKYKNATRPQTVRLDFKDKFVKYFNKKITKSGILNDLQPREFLSEVLGLDLNMVQYINGNIASDFNKINQMAYKEYEYYKDLLKEFVKTGVRVKFNEVEELCITSDITIDNLNAVNIGIDDVDILEKNISEEDDYIVNKITGNFYERNKFVQDFDGDYVWFEYSIIINEAILSNPSLYEFNTIEVTDVDLFERTQIGDLVLLEDTQNENCFYGKPISYDESTSTVSIQLGFDKDNQLYQKGRLESLFPTYNASREFNLYFVRRQLPYIWQKQLNIGGEKRSRNLKIPILPQVNGRDENSIYQEVEFGFPENIEIGEYSGYVDDINKIYKTHNPSDLYYNKEIKQFSSTSDNPVYALSTRIDNPTYDKKGDNEYLTFNTFDNSNLEIDIEESESKDANITFKNINTIDESDIKLIEQTNIEQISSRIFKISLSYYNMLNIGDIVTLKEPTEITGEYLENRDLNWIIESLYNDTGEYYMALNGSIKDTFDFEVYPAQSVVYLNEFSLLGNPIIEYISPFEYSNSNSILEFEEREVEIDGRLLNYEGFQKLADYYYSNFGGTEENTTKRIIPLKLRNKIELQKYDIVEIENIKYIVLGEATKDALTGNQSTYYVMNINTQNSTPANIPLKRYLKYEPVDIPIYNHNGNEGTLNEDKTGIDGDNIVSKLDEQYGLVTLNPLSTTALRGNVSNVESDKLFTINATIGVGYDNWLTNGEYRVIRIDSEFILGKITSSNKFKIVKRELIQSPKTEIKINKEIKFYSIMNINIDGKSRFSEFKAGNNDKFIEFSEDTGIDINSDKGYIGSDNNYFDITNSKIAIGATTSNGYFSVGNISSNKYLIYDNGSLDIKSTDTIDISNTNNELYFAPTGEVSSLRLATSGDEGYFSVGNTTSTDYIEYDNTTSKLNIKGNVDIVSGSGFNQIFRQDTEPTGGNYNEGDIWVDTDDNNKMYQYSTASSDFASNLVQDSASKARVVRDTSFPINPSSGDICIRTDEENAMYVYDGASWQKDQDSATAQSTANQALSELDNIGNDGILTPTEKVTANEKWKEIQDEYSNLTTKAINIGYITSDLDTKWGAYKTAYDSLDSYLNIVLSPLDTEESINRTNWNNKWKAYYDEAKIINVILGNYIVDYTNVKVGDNAVTKPTSGTGEGFYVNTGGYARIHNGLNSNNDLYFAPADSGESSYLKIAQNGGDGEFSVGDPSSTEYLKYEGGACEFEGRYFNKTAYVSTREEFVGALDTTINDDGFGGDNPYYQQTINKIIVKETIDVAGSTINPLKPSSDINEITSYDKTVGCSDLWLRVDFPTLIHRITFQGLGYSGGAYPIALDCGLTDNAMIKDVEFIGLGGSIEGNYGDTTLSGIEMSFSGLFVFASIYKFTNVSDIRLEGVPLGVEIFSAVENLSDVYINTGASGGESVCNGVENINNVSIRITDPTTFDDLFVACDNVSNITINPTVSSSMGLFKSCDNISNVIVENPTNVTGDHFNGCNYISNINGTTDASDIVNCTKIDPYTVSWDVEGKVRMDGSRVQVYNGTSWQYITGYGI